MSNWSEELDKLKERVKKVIEKSKGVDTNADKIKEHFNKITNYLEASEEIIKREAGEQPKIKKSVEELVEEIAKLETIIANLETKQKALEEKTRNMSISCVAGGTLVGVIGSVAFWKTLPKVKKWLGL